MRRHSSLSSTVEDNHDLTSRFPPQASQLPDQRHGCHPRGSPAPFCPRRVNHSVEGHGILKNPAPTSPKGYGNYYSMVIKSDKIKPAPGQSFGTYAEIQPNRGAIADKVEAAIKVSEYSTLRDFIVAKQENRGDTPYPLSTECAFTDPNGTPRDLPEKLEFVTGKKGLGFFHVGPCEVWCDEEVVVPYMTNCYTSNGVLPYARDKCEGKKQLTLYWLAVHQKEWQVYINCVPIKGGTGRNDVEEEGNAADATEPVTPRPPTETSSAPIPAATEEASKLPACRIRKRV